MNSTAHSVAPASRGAARSQVAGMTFSAAVVWLALLVGILALVAAGAGVFWQSEGSSFTFTTLRGETVTIFGQDLYRYDTTFFAGGFRGQDAVVLLFGLPLLALSTWAYRRGSLRGGLVLLGTLGYFLYVYASMALSAAYNNLFLVYVALFSASLFAFVLAFGVFDRQALAARYGRQLPRRGPALFMFLSGLVVLVVWGGPLAAALLRNEAPATLDSYTTMFTHAVDIAVIGPAAILAGILIWRREVMGYLLLAGMIILEIMLAPLIAGQTIVQLSLGLTLTTGEIVGPVASFALLGLLALGVLVAILRRLDS
jgi:hypothetical protein